MNEIDKKARELMAGTCRVCAKCDGRACAGEVPGMGGVGTGSGFRANVQALADLKFNMRLMHDVTAPDPSVTLLGMDLPLPVLAAPVAGVSFNMGGGISEQDLAEAVLGGCSDKGVIGCTGDGAPDEIYQAGFAAIRKVDGRGIPVIKPWADEELYRKLAQAAELGAPAVGMDIDAAGLITLAKMGRPVGPRTVDQMAEVVRKSGLKIILKGIMTAGDAMRAVDAGAAGIVVSNHGGRVLDHTPGTAEVLPEIAAEVKGRLAVLVDGGVRTGGDVLKMLALGADAVMIGRPVARAAIGGGRDAVKAYFDRIETELVSTMVLTATKSVAAVDQGILRRDITR